MNKDQMARSAMAGLFALGMISAGGAVAGDAKDMEKCWGLAKAGQNDCGSNKTSHSCAGQSKKDYDPNDFKAVKSGTCVQLGGSLKMGEPGKLAKGAKS